MPGYVPARAKYWYRHIGYECKWQSVHVFVLENPGHNAPGQNAPKNCRKKSPGHIAPPPLTRQDIKNKKTSAVARRLRDASAVLFGLKFADDIKV